MYKRTAIKLSAEFSAETLQLDVKAVKSTTISIPTIISQGIHEIILCKILHEKHKTRGGQNLVL